jgi:hypothetical protein
LHLGLLRVELLRCAGFGQSSKGKAAYAAIVVYGKAPLVLGMGVMFFTYQINSHFYRLGA